MNKTKAFVSAARLRTLPLSLSGIIVGSAIAAHEGKFNVVICVLALITTIGFQVLSNFANDYGDGIKGTDNEHRIGPMRALQSGVITPAEMKKAMIVTTILTMIAAIALIYVSFGSENSGYALFFFLLGLACIGAAIKYTVGSGAYGYRGLGDIFVFIFFGLVAVVGSYFLYAQQLQFSVFLPAITIGLLSVGVLNLNNMRDRESDERSGKLTLAVKLGAAASRKYHVIVIVLAIVSSLGYLFIEYNSWINLIFLLSFIPLILHIKRVVGNVLPKALDPELKTLALSTFLFSLLFTLSFNIFL
ncbi:1,4-dihydroxy-2-naphthoate polyprenyltransferase [Robertkochia solimangrovi]|uniref:1,4-dihydroxy-2-naphthoate polyprenyltransferase n=1 Tax=Robertkochia solimangrovi TaxID=2213046 RepID=UPI0011813847|nr:1,4-dihydroxy-2-naphthoate polyprenyltransferase [Robertkochia solimangrovi]TRZ42603.1 1,4-dihydroxy-2-naphthoate octaprenyltransferase [Robertkochia solimangrovi]